MRRTIMLPVAAFLATACLVSAPAQAVATAGRPAGVAVLDGNSLARAASWNGWRAHRSARPGVMMAGA
jgi:hypothetical protein